ncbi:MAG: hypothetical protein IPJ42_21775 [Betaproteobacteria bacterium]|nr:hypothetical protein [Betaproteobacteria bacterium]
MDRWLKEQVLAPQTTRCAVPAGVFPAEGTMLRMVASAAAAEPGAPAAAHRPRQPWEPVWAAKVPRQVRDDGHAGHGDAFGQSGGGKPSEGETQVPNVKDVLRGIFRR